MQAIHGPRFAWFAAKAAMKSKHTKAGRYVKHTGVVGTFYGVTVVRSRAKFPYGYGYSTWQNNLNNKTHRVEHIYICWYDGRIVAQAVRWLCSGFTPHFALLAGQDVRPCAACEQKFLAENLEKPSATQHLGVDCR